VIGSQAIAGTASGTIAGRQTAWLVEATATETIRTLLLRSNNSEWKEVTSLWLGIFADNAGTPGTLLGQAQYSGKPPTGGQWLPVSGLSVPVVAGTKYWLAFLTNGGASAYLQTTSGTATVRRSTKTTYSQLTATTEWNAAESQGPLSLYGAPVAVANEKQTGSTTQEKITIPTASKGSVILAFLSQNAGSPAPKPKDNISGETGWTVNPTSALYNASARSVWLASKTAVGGETEIAFTPGGGVGQGISYCELSGLGEGWTVDAIVAKSNNASATSSTTGALTTTDPGDVVLIGVALLEGSGTIEAWTGTGPAANVGTETTRLIGGTYIPEAVLTLATFTAHWTTTRVNGSLVVAIKPTSTALKGTSSATATAAGKAQAVGVPKGASTATGTAAGKAQAAGAPKAASSATGGAALKGSASGVLRGAGAASATGAGRLQASGVLRGSWSATGAAAARLAAAGVLRGVEGATAVLAGLLQAAGSPRGSSGASATAAARGVAAGALRGTGAATGAAAGGLQAPGSPAGRVAGTADVRGGAGASGVARGVIEATAAVAGRLGALGALRGRIEALGEWLGRLSGETTAQHAVVSSVRVRERVHVNVMVRPVLDVSSRVRERVGVNVRVRGSSE
jgi:hypothetical protein